MKTTLKLVISFNSLTTPSLKAFNSIDEVLKFTSSWSEVEMRLVCFEECEVIIECKEVRQGVYSDVVMGIK